jgi:hypothetical protein
MDKTEKLRQIALEYSQAVKELQTIQKMEDEKKAEIRQIIQKFKEVTKC